MRGMGSYRLLPTAGQPYLDPHEVVRRLGAEFDHCNAVEENVVYSGENAYEVTIADGEASPVRLTFQVRANKGLIIQYDSSEHDLATCRLRQRCASVLEYESIRI